MDRRKRHYPSVSLTSPACLYLPRCTYSGPMDSENRAEPAEPQLPQQEGGDVGAFFDVDETLVRGASAFWAARELFSQRLFRLRDLQFVARQTLRFVLVGENKNKIREFGERAAGVLEGNSVEQLVAISEDLFDRYFVPKVYQATYERLVAHRANGDQVWLISATPWLIAETFAKRLGAAGGVGTRMAFSGDRLLGHIDGQLVHGAGKVTVIEEIAEQRDIDLSKSWAYSDSANDIPMLSRVGHPVAVNPDQELLVHAVKNDWEILNARERRDVVIRSALKAGIGTAIGITAGYITWSGLKLGRRRTRT